MTSPALQPPSRLRAPLAPPVLYIVRVVAYAGVIGAFAAGNTGRPLAAVALAAAAWVVGAGFLLRPSRQDADFLDRFVVTLAIIAAAFHLMTAHVGRGGDLAEWVGQPAPDITVTTLDGETLRLSDLRGRKVMIDIWATWCPPCRAVIPHLVALDQSMGDGALAIIGISDEPPETLRPFVEQFSVSYPVVSAQALPAPYGLVRTIPTLFVIDSQGIIQSVVAGYHDFDALRALATQRDWRTAPGD